MKIRALLVTIHKQDVFFSLSFQNKCNLDLLCKPLVILKPPQPVWEKGWKNKDSAAHEGEYSTGEKNKRKKMRVMKNYQWNYVWKIILLDVSGNKYTKHRQVLLLSKTLFWYQTALAFWESTKKHLGRSSYNTAMDTSGVWACFGCL